MPNQYPTLCPQRALMFINKLSDTIKQFEFVNTETLLAVLVSDKRSSILANITAYKQND